MAKVAIKSEKLTPFGGIFSIMEQFDSRLSSVIDSSDVPPFASSDTSHMQCRHDS